MKLDLKNIFKVEGSSLAFDYKMDLSGFAYEPGFYPFQKPVSVKGQVMNHVGIVKLTADVAYAFKTQCDRCAADLVEEASIPMQMILVKELNDEENDDFVVVEDDRLELDEQVKDLILLNIPSKHLCKEDCKGLCPRCGKNLNDGPCSCKAEGDSKLQGLKHFFE